jgi:hypothetical protein
MFADDAALTFLRRRYTYTLIYARYSRFRRQLLISPLPFDAAAAS